MTRYILKGFAITGVVAFAAATCEAAPEAKARDADRKSPGKPAAGQHRYLDAEHGPKGQGWFALFNGKDLAGWHKRPDHKRPMSWKVVGGAMVNEASHGKPGTDIVSDWTFRDFELYYEYRVGEGNNSGMYLRGRYEIQILGDYGQEPSPGTNGGIWATAAPSRNVSRRPGEWQSVYTKIVGTTVESVVLNGVRIHENVAVPRPTGGHLDDKVDEPGPIMIQGDHGAIEVRTVMIRPLEVKGRKYLDSKNSPKGPGWIDLCNGKDLAGWHRRPGHDRPLSWKVVAGVMVNTTSPEKHGTDIVSDRKFKDFELYYEYRIPKGSNSGMYLRGRYEIQICDDYGQAPGTGSNGALYSLAPPARNASRKPGEWQSVYARIVGKKVSVILNGVKTVDNIEATRPTGGELDRDVGKPGPIMIQGDHGSIDVRRLMLRPIAATRRPESN